MSRFQDTGIKSIVATIYIMIYTYCLTKLLGGKFHFCFHDSNVILRLRERASVICSVYS